MTLNSGSLFAKSKYHSDNTQSILEDYKVYE